MLSGKPPPVMWASALIAAGRAEGGEQRLHVDPRRLEQRLAEAAARARTAPAPSQDSPDAPTIRRTSEKPFECTPEEGRPRSTSPGAMSGARQERAALGRADREAGEVVVAAGVEPGHLGGLAADQRAAGLRQPSAMPLTIATPTSGASLPVAK